jgi:hypothetical protein
MKGFIASAIIGYAAATTLDQNDIEFMRYLAQYNKEYTSIEQYNMRKDRYMQIDAEINYLNSSQTSSLHGHNYFSDWTEEEWQASLLDNYTPSDPSQFELKASQTNAFTGPEWWSWGYRKNLGDVLNFHASNSTCKASYAYAAASLMEMR